jgi:nucleotide-binding universal stress UspA family protein
MYQNILVPVDGSGASTRGLREAIRLAQGTHGKLRLVHVVNTAVIAMEYAAALGPMDDLENAAREDGQALLRHAEDFVRENDVQFESVLLETASDNTGELIVAQAAQWPADAVVMGTHGRRGLRRLVLGSNAEYVVRHTSVPVVLVRQQ